jgi:hypothetical protein
MEDLQGSTVKQIKHREPSYKFRTARQHILEFRKWVNHVYWQLDSMYHKQRTKSFLTRARIPGNQAPRPRWQDQPIPQGDSRPNTPRSRRNTQEIKSVWQVQGLPLWVCLLTDSYLWKPGFDYTSTVKWRIRTDLTTDWDITGQKGNQKQKGTKIQANRLRKLKKYICQNARTLPKESEPAGQVYSRRKTMVGEQGLKLLLTRVCKTILRSTMGYNTNTGMAAFMIFMFRPKNKFVV